MLVNELVVRQLPLGQQLSNRLRNAGLKTITRQKAIDILRQANENGKNKGSDNLDDFNYLRPGSYVLTETPLHNLDFIHQSDDRERFYAAVPGKFPPVLAVFSERVLKSCLENGEPIKAAVTNGNHRCCAAQLRSDATILTVMHERQYRLFRRSIAQEIFKPAGSIS